MKKEELPQDKSHLKNFTREVCYVKNSEGKYVTDLSTGWEVKSAALNNQWDEIERRIKKAKEKIINGKASPILYFFELKLMDLTVLSGYTGFSKWRIKRHMRPNVFKNLNDKTLQVYAEIFEISLNDLKNFNV